MNLHPSDAADDDDRRGKSFINLIGNDKIRVERS